MISYIRRNMVAFVATTLLGPVTCTISTAGKVQRAPVDTGSASTATTVEFYDNQVALGNG